MTRACNASPLKLTLTLVALFVNQSTCTPKYTPHFGRISPDEYILTREQIRAFHREGCTTLPNVLTEEEVCEIEQTFDKFLNREIHVPGKDFCDMSKPFNTPFDQWSIVNCMLPTKYHPPFANNVYERLTRCISRQLFPTKEMMKDYDQLLNKRPGKGDAVFAWHQDMGYWPGPKELGVKDTSTVTFSLAVDNSEEVNGCLRYVAGSGREKKLRPHEPALGDSRDDGHALAIKVDEKKGDVVKLAPCPRGSVTIHDEYIVHGSSGNSSKERQRRTYVVAYRTRQTVEAERRIGFTHSHNDQVNWDTFQDGECREKKTE
mmetsp:Transcript_6385/g.9293  ORF Transcript_6385/g.9293 Transcript_6385/m.9293 type:complete len:318 (+) Transcript_6385:224-1177(+)|eukprot:CAMPEP_0195513344 /NCGR_PEP_ID=MMETSP0794_2-20130614/5018_1 /TAXON_ID=515487 /ORGANISM="Stephanopyxis turris, Strain CCMP 815" /LENGTH=317 /DNA_ID=CAMNT_0040641335 /DNA_START=210 /DNA_END=1163 /DNA_ORIENTATION=+